MVSTWSRPARSRSSSFSSLGTIVPVLPLWAMFTFLRCLLFCRSFWKDGNIYWMFFNWSSWFSVPNWKRKTMAIYFIFALKIGRNSSKTLCMYVPFHNVLPSVQLEAALSTALHIRTQSSPRVSRTCVSLYPNQIFSENDLVTFRCWLQHNVSCCRGQNQIFSLG